MNTSLPVALSAQLALEKRLETVAHNVANSRTAGFRAEEAKFESLVSRAGRDPVAFASRGETYLSRESGEMLKTGNPLDVAISGEAFLAIQTPAGPVFTRDGRMKITPEGELRTLNDYTVLDVGQAPIVIDPNGGEPVIGPDGMIHQDGVPLGAIGMFTFPENAKLTRYDNSGVTSEVAPQPVVEFIGNKLHQGFIEGSNVNPIKEITRLIELQRLFESASNLVSTSERSVGEAIRGLGPQS